MKTLTKVMQQFVWEICEAFTTLELPKEARAHGRCMVALTAKGNSHMAKGKAITDQK
jgi:hypothetical protein